jgi:hypothetical protein
MSFLPLLNIATIACIGLLVGSEICLTAFTNPVLRKLDEPAQLKAAHLLTARLATPLPLWNVCNSLYSAGPKYPSGHSAAPSSVHRDKLQIG